VNCRAVDIDQLVFEICDVVRELRLIDGMRISRSASATHHGGNPIEA
jgi:hypothetical protein